MPEPRTDVTDVTATDAAAAEQETAASEPVDIKAIIADMDAEAATLPADDPATEPDAAPAGDEPDPEDAAIPAFRRRMRGYDRGQVDMALTVLGARLAGLEADLATRDARIDELDEQLRRTRMELRYWQDRQAFIDAEIDRARQTAREMEVETRERCERLEQDAQQRAITMIDRVCTEANGILAHAREEAQALVARYDDDVALGERRIQQLGDIQKDIVHAMRAAMSRFEDGITELDIVTPSAQAVRHPAPGRERAARATPTFGRERAAAAGSATPAPAPSGQGTIDTRTQVQITSSPREAEAEQVDAMLLLGGPF